MRTILLFALLCLTGASFGAVSKFELLLGVRAGGGAMFSKQDFELPGTDMAVKSIGFGIPVKAEVLFGVKGFRIGYRFEFMHGIFTKDHREFSPEIPPLVVNNSPVVDIRRYHLSHFVILEFAIPAGEHFAVVPAFGVGAFSGYVVDKKNNNFKTEYRDVVKNPIAFSAGFNFEFNWKRAYFILGPNYSFYRMKMKDKAVDGNGAIHALTLDLAFRLNLFKPNYKPSK